MNKLQTNTEPEIISVLEPSFGSCFEDFGAKSIVGNCKANPNVTLDFQNCTQSQIEYARQNGIKIKSFKEPIGQGYSIEAIFKK
jgi:hypothetical protein